MSMFLPEGFSDQTQKGTATVAPANPETTSTDIALMQRVLAAASRNPNLIPSDFMAYLIDYIATQRLTIPIGQVFGYDNSVNSIVSQSIAGALAGMFLTHIANSESEVSVTSTSYATFTSAPSITGLDNGSYLVIWGASVNGDDGGGGSACHLTYRANGSTDGNICEQQAQFYSSIARGDTVTLAAGAGLNTLELVALTTNLGHTSKVRYAWIACLKYAN